MSVPCNVTFHSQHMIAHNRWHNNIMNVNNYITLDYSMNEWEWVRSEEGDIPSYSWITGKVDFFSFPSIWTEYHIFSFRNSNNLYHQRKWRNMCEYVTYFYAIRVAKERSFYDKYSCDHWLGATMPNYREFATDSY